MRAAVVFIALIGCYPEFQFGAGGSGGGGGDDVSSSRAAGSTTDGMGAMGQGGVNNQGGQAQHTTSQGGFESVGGAPDGPATSTSTGTAPPMPFVECGDGNGVIVACDPGEVCCFSLEAQSMDHCDPTTDCGFDYYTLACNAQADCPAEVCCALIDGLGDLIEISCQASCTDPDRRMCADASECMPGEQCTKLFSSSFAPEYATDYKYCSTP